jgi:hypothetical protein
MIQTLAPYSAAGPPNLSRRPMTGPLCPFAAPFGETLNAHDFAHLEDADRPAPPARILGLKATQTPRFSPYFETASAPSSSKRCIRCWASLSCGARHSFTRR